MTAMAPSVVRCGGHNRAGKPCGHPAGWGTDHVGSGNCKNHGGSSPSGRKHAARIVANQVAGELDMAPDEALLWLVERAAYRVAWWTMRVDQLEPDALIVTEERVKVVTGRIGDREAPLGSSEKTTSNRAELHIALRAMTEAEDQLARYSKLALDAGVDERRVRALEQIASAWAEAIRVILDRLQLTPEQRKLAPAAVEEGLRLLEGGRGA